MFTKVLYTARGLLGRQNGFRRGKFGCVGMVEELSNYFIRGHDRGEDKGGFIIPYINIYTLYINYYNIYIYNILIYNIIYNNILIEDIEMNDIMRGDMMDVMPYYYISHDMVTNVSKKGII